MTENQPTTVTVLNHRVDRVVLSKYLMQRGKNLAIESAHRLAPWDTADAIARGLEKARAIVILSRDAMDSVGEEGVEVYVPAGLRGEVENAVKTGRVPCVEMA